MSHFTQIKTCFKNLLYLEKALDKLNIAHKQKLVSDSKSFSTNLVIPQSNNYDIEFIWSGEEYNLVIDQTFWKQSFSIENFIQRLSQKYAGETIINESQKIGFRPVKYQQNLDGSNTLVLERWNSLI